MNNHVIASSPRCANMLVQFLYMYCISTVYLRRPTIKKERDILGKPNMSIPESHFCVLAPAVIIQISEMGVR